MAIDTEPPSSPPENPYVGPRALRPGEPFYGRDREVVELRDVLVARRIVLLYSPSGAGKSSLLEAGLRPKLDPTRFEVPETIRVGHEVPPSLSGLEPDNRYVLSVVLSLEEGRDEAKQLPPERLAKITLGEYFDSLIEPGSIPHPDASSDPQLPSEPAEVVQVPHLCLLFDQFEELFTLDPTDYDKKEQFLDQLGLALRDRSRWALFAMREDFIARLDPYVERIPTRLETRFRLDQLGTEAARLAARLPSEAAGVPFSKEAAAKLVDDLRRIQVQRGDRVVPELGPYVEPVQLQVVCRELWKGLWS